MESKFRWTDYGTSINHEIYQYGFIGGRLKLYLACDDAGWYHGCECFVPMVMMTWHPYREMDPHPTREAAAVECLKKLKMHPKVDRPQRVALASIQRDIEREGL